MESKDGKSTSVDEKQKPDTTKLDKSKLSDLKEKSYVTRQVETSVTLLDSPENDIVLEALLFISKYADINNNNLIYLIKSGIVSKLLNSFTKNICILRISLRLLSVVLSTDDGLYEIDQDKYDDKILEISNMYIGHKDGFVKEYCVEILAKVASSCRVTTIIFNTDLFNPMFDNIKSAKNVNSLYHNMLLFYKLIDAPAALSALAEYSKFDTNIIIAHMNHKEKKVGNFALETIEKLTKYGLPFLQESFKKFGIMEKMFKILMDEQKEYQHSTVINIIHNCLNSEETSTYFVESIEFLELCQWVKNCHPRYLLPLSELFIKITNTPDLQQMLFDLSVEESILYFFRLKHKDVINQTCRAVSNMTAHKYCCEHMLTPVVAETLVEVLERQNDEEDPYNQIAWKTVFHFIRRSVNGLTLFMEKKIKPVLLDFFLNKAHLVTEETYLMIIEIIFRCLVHPQYQEEFIHKELLQEVLKLFKESENTVVTTFCCEIMTSINHLNAFRTFFLQNGPLIIINKLKNLKDVNLITEILYFIFSCLIYEDIAMAFLHQGLLQVLKTFDEYISYNIPILKKVNNLAINYYLPLKFYKTGKLEITDKLPNKFYVINGIWCDTFPFIEILEMMKVTPYPTIYLVDYSYEVRKGVTLEAESQETLKSTTSLLSKSTDSNLNSTTLSRISLTQSPSVFDIKYGKISTDIFLPRYIYHLKKYDVFLQGPMEDRIRLLAEYVDTLLCGPKDDLSLPQKIHEYQLHIQCLKEKLGNNIIPIGFLRMGFHCERALLFKALADKICIPCSLVKGSLKIYWNEVALFKEVDGEERLQIYVIDLMYEIGNLMLVGTKQANKYCNLN
ncbi:uncharacterized protein LOC126745056 [Anthonomus grandis grandis]|uniref:uncharacterized protein LOC126745056 n=1 Tax=Anthonomus grandis grandis TaxID=2921223 RepID=UPI0021666C69|nr:uncharacterized protein LOC126745056 [Anthonomus grandis grandis]